MSGSLLDQLDRKRGRGKRLSPLRQAAEKGQYGPAVMEFVQCVHAYQQSNGVRQVSYSEMFELVLFLGYRKVCPPAASIHDLPDPDESVAPAAADVGPVWCVYCGRKNDRRSRNKRLCTACAAQYAVKCKKQSDAWRAAGLCAYCGQNKPKPGRKTCETCLRKKRLAKAVAKVA